MRMQIALIAATVGLGSAGATSAASLYQSTPNLAAYPYEFVCSSSNCAGANPSPSYQGFSDFTPTQSGTATSLTYVVSDPYYGGSNALGPETISIYDGPAGSLGSEIFTEQVNAAASGVATAGFPYQTALVTVSLPSLALEAGQTYSFSIYGAGNGISVPIFNSTFEPGTTGDLVQYTNNVAGQTTAGESVGFNIAGTPISAAPEPSSWALMIAGLAAAGLMMRRGKRRVAGSFSRLLVV